MNTIPSDALHPGEQPLASSAGSEGMNPGAAYVPMLEVSPARVTYASTAVTAPKAPKAPKSRRTSRGKTAAKHVNQPVDELAERRQAKKTASADLNRKLKARMEWVESTVYDVPRLLAGMLSDLRSASLLHQIQMASTTQEASTGNPWLLNDREYWCRVSGLHPQDFQDVLHELKERRLIEERRCVDADHCQIYTELRFDAIEYAESVAALREDIREWISDGLLD